MPEPEDQASPPEADDDPLALARRVQAEVEAEAAALRRRDPELAARERELARVWAEVAPPGATGDERTLLLDRLEQLAHVDVDVATGSKAGVSQVKRTIRKLLYWYLRYLADQINAVHGVLVRLLRRFDGRLDRVEHALDLDRIDLIDPAPGPGSEAAKVIAELFDTGPVAVLSCADGSVVAALQGRAPAYGVDGDAERVVVGARAGLDLRPGDPAEHLTGLGDGSLAGLVLAGFVEDLAMSAVQRTLVDALRAIGPGGRIVVAVADPAERDVVERDIRAGRGAAPATWAHLAGRLGARAELVAVDDPRTGTIVVVEPD